MVLQNYQRVSCLSISTLSGGFDGCLGLMDENETPEEAALRELREETGYIGEKVVEVSPIIASDPGWDLQRHITWLRSSDFRFSGMTNSTMKLVSVAVTCKDQLETPEQKLDDGESITLRVVELSKLNQILKGE